VSSPISVDIGELSFALSSHDVEHYLDLQTGDVFPWFEDCAEDDEVIAAAMEETPERFLMIDPISSHEGYRWMEDFAATQPDELVREALLDALDRPKPFRRFKDTLLSYPEVREEWFRVEEQHLLEFARAWLEIEEVDVELISKRDSAAGGAPDHISDAP
jgi:hypothetical protein